MFERFTDRARQVIVLAQEEARRFNHNFIGTEHILLGLMSEGEGVAARVLNEMGISLEAARTRTVDIIGKGEVEPSGHIPFTPRAKKVLELALREALVLGHNYIDTEHLLLGLVREGKGTAVQVLTVMAGNDALSRSRNLVLCAPDSEDENIAPEPNLEKDLKPENEQLASSRTLSVTVDREGLEEAIAKIDEQIKADRNQEGAQDFVEWLWNLRDLLRDMLATEQ
jgi:ATP-dependent Clp protease ATP-binding subunit ClpA